VPLSFRVRPALKAKMEQAVAEDGRSLMSEIENRIEWSFDHLERLGGERVARLLEGFAQAAVAKFGVGWIDDPTRFEAVEELWKGMMIAARPVVRNAPRVARPAREAAADDIPAEGAGSARHDHELLEQMLQRIDDVARLLEEMRAETRAQPQAAPAEGARAQAGATHNQEAP
jgi:hypothetical protein